MIQLSLFSTPVKIGLDNLIAIVDRNTLQITGKTVEVCNTEPLFDKFTAFGWEVREVDGHDISALTEVLSDVPFVYGKPNLIIADTVKGKGISFMEDIRKWHHGVPSDEEFGQAIRELDTALTEMSNGEFHESSTR